MSNHFLPDNPHRIVDLVTADDAMRGFIATIANMSLDGETEGREDVGPYEQSAEDAVDTLQALISKARDIVDRRLALQPENYGAPS